MKHNNTVSKIIATILAVMMLATTMPGSAFADESNTLTIGSVSGPVGTTVSIPVSISLAEAASGIGFSITYDDNLTLDNTTLNTSLVTSGQFSQNLSYGTNGAKFLINWANDMKQASGVLFYLNFTISGDAGNSTLPISFSSSASTMITDSSDNANYLSVSTTNGNVYSKNYYSVSFESNGGSSVSAQTVVYGDKITEPAAPTKTGYTFAGWYSDSALTSAWNFSDNTIGAANMTMYAAWTINSYTVTFESNGGSAVPSQTIDYGNTIDEPVEPTLSKHVFLGWFLDEELTSTWDFSNDTMGTSGITLYARWELRGDVNGNGSIDLQDYMLLQKAYLGTTTLTSTQEKIGDMDADGNTGELSDCIALAELYLEL